MTRNRRSAKNAGAAFERLIADGLKEHLRDDTIDRRVKTGARDRGDIANVKINGHRLVLECKDVTHETCPTCKRVTGLKLPEWIAEAKKEAHNDAALAGFVVVKRRGTTDPLKQYLVGTVQELISLITGLPEETHD